MRLASLQTYLHGKAEECYAVVRQPLSAAAVFDALLPALQAQLRFIASLRAQQDDLLAEIQAAVEAGHRTEEVRLIETIPGYGTKLAATMVACLPEDLRSWGVRVASRKNVTGCPTGDVTGHSDDRVILGCRQAWSIPRTRAKSLPQEATKPPASER